LVEGLLATRVDEARLVRRARLWIEKPTDLPAQDRELDRLDRHGLTTEELELCPPILVLADSASVSRRTQAGLMRLLTSGLPLKVLWFDECDLTSPGPSMPLVAMAHRRAFVLSTSISDPTHLFEGVTAALRYPGPAFISVHTPSPRRHGFATELSIDRAALAVLSRVHPALRFDPAAEGVFGLRIDLGGNPAVERTWAADSEGVEWTPLRWAEGEKRFEDSTLLPDARGSAQSTVPGPNGRGLALGKILKSASGELEQVWHTLQELSGLVTPFTDAVRSRAEAETQEAHEAALAELRAEFEGRLATHEQEQAATQADRLRRRLLQLAGYGER
jgi:pyruvate-ferredoxin/flavodoxin oxidoreductase